MRPSTGGEAKIEYLRLSPQDDGVTMEACIRILQLWMRAESRDYYRVVSPSPGASAYYDQIDHRGLCWAGSGSEMEEQVLAGIHPAEMPWDPGMEDLAAKAARVPSSFEALTVLVDGSATV